MQPALCQLYRHTVVPYKARGQKLNKEESIHSLYPLPLAFLFLSPLPSPFASLSSLPLEAGPLFRLRLG